MDVQTHTFGRGDDVDERLATVLRVGDDAVLAETSATDLELWLDEHDDITAALDERGDRAEHERERDEGEVTDDEVERAEVIRTDVADGGAAALGDPRVLTQQPHQLPMADVERGDVACSTAEEDLGEAPGRGAHVEADAVPGREPLLGPQGEGVVELVCRSPHPPRSGGENLHVRRVVDRGGRLPRHPPGHRNRPGFDELACLAPRAGQASADELGVEPSDVSLPGRSGDPGACAAPVRPCRSGRRGRPPEQRPDRAGRHR